MAKVKKMVTENWRTTLFSLIAAGALGYTGYKTGDTALVVAAAGILTGGVSASDSK